MVLDDEHNPVVEFVLYINTCKPVPAAVGSNMVPVTPGPDHAPGPRVDVGNAVNKLMGALGRHIGLMVPDMAEGIYCSTGTMAVVVCKQPTPPYTYVTVLLPIAAKDGVNMPDADVGAVTLQVPPAGKPVKLKDGAFEHTVDTAVIEGVAGLTMVKLVVPTLEQEGADNGVTVTEYCMEEEILAVGFDTLVLLNPVPGDQL